MWSFFFASHHVLFFFFLYLFGGVLQATTPKITSLANGMLLK
jgi:hypothetical protein